METFTISIIALSISFGIPLASLALGWFALRKKASNGWVSRLEARLEKAEQENKELRTENREHLAEIKRLNNERMVLLERLVNKGE